MADIDNPFGDDDNRTVIVPKTGGKRTRKPPEPMPPDTANQDDAVGADEYRTVIVPSPGGRRRREREPVPVPPEATPAPRPSTLPESTIAKVALRPSGVNPLIDAALPLLTLGAQLRHTAAPQDIQALRNQVGRAIQTFETDARGKDIERETGLVARHVLCTFIDEMVLSTPWGSESIWSQNSMLSTFHKETGGGEKFFMIIERLLQDPVRNVDLLELMYACMCLGFEGKYRVRDHGRTELMTVEDSVYRAIHGQRGDFERDLSPHWRGLEDRRSALARFVPLWVIGAVAATILLGLYIIFSYSLGRSADPVYAEIMLIGGAPAPRAPSTEPPTLQELGLREFLAAEIAASQVDITEVNNRTALLIRGDGLFPSGSAEPASEFLPLLRRIAEGIAREPGNVLVTGHTDNVPIRTLRFPSNWELSEERAVAVADLLLGFMPAGADKQLTAEARADTEPLVPNDSAENRATNRRVEVILLGSTTGSVAAAAGN